MNSSIHHFYFASGVGRDKYKLVSFDNALINAGFSEYNLVRVSSILPANCLQSQKIELTKGSPLLVAYGSLSSNEVNRILSSAICVAIPQVADEIGIIMEFSDYCDKHTAETRVCEMAEKAMRNHDIAIKQILCSSIDAHTMNDFTTVFSGLAMW